jgi:hypothetical protein
MNKYTYRSLGMLGQMYVGEDEADMREGEFYLASEVDARIADLEKALRWAIEEGASFNSNSKTFYDAGCGCCSGDVEPPEDIKGMLIGLMDSVTK